MSNVKLPAVYDPPIVREYSVGVRTFQEREVRRVRLLSRGMLAYSVVVSVLLAASVATLSYTVPAVRLQPVYMIARQDGTFDTVNSQWALPASFTDVQKRAWLWQYVSRREAYVRADARDNYDVVSAMSAPDVRERFQAYWNDKIPGSPSPPRVMGREGVIKVAFRDSELLPNNRFQVRYCRYVQMEGQPVFVQPMIASLTYQQLETVPLLERFQYNPGALVVTGYAGAVPQGTGGAAAGDCGPMAAF